VKRSLKTQLSLTTAMMVLFTVLLISFLSNIFINLKFKDYISEQQKQKTKEIVSSLSQQYNIKLDSWNVNFIHTIGMYALYDGYIIRVYDVEGESVWDAEKHDMTLCMQVMADISQRMKEKYPKINGEFISQNYNLVQSGKIVGSVSISYFGPYFLSENDFQFISALNTILISIGIFSFILSILIGWMMARRISKPISKTVDIAKEISAGNYSIGFEDITKTKELDELILSINHLAKSLKDQEELRKQLTADVSHELRTPLTTVATHLEAMIEGVWEPTQCRLQSCYEEVNGITTLVRDLEQLAKAESNKLKLNKTSFDLMNIINNIINFFEIEIKNKNLKVTIDGDLGSVVADKDRIIQVIRNLLSNAIKYTLDHGHVKIKIIDTEKSVIFTVEDDGIGISEEDIPFVFERFYRADKSRNRKTGGTGIGLAIVKSIVSAHGGKVEVKSKVNYGSSFKVTLPR
jgi:signal transduction histidine kinase